MTKKPTSRTLINKLKKLGFAPGDTEENMDTVSSITVFQRMNSLKQTGKFDDDTIKVLSKKK